MINSYFLAEGLAVVRMTNLSPHIECRRRCHSQLGARIDFPSKSYKIAATKLSNKWIGKCALHFNEMFTTCRC